MAWKCSNETNQRQEIYYLSRHRGKKMKGWKETYINIVEPVQEKAEEEIVNERLKYHSKSPAELKGSDFDRNLELKNIKKMLKMIEKAHDFHSKFQ